MNARLPSDSRGGPGPGRARFATAPLRPAMLALLALLLAAPGHAQRDRAPLVAAASDLQFALQDIASDFEDDTGERVRLTMGSSGNFARQIRQGAPYQLYLSADEEYVLDLARDGYTRDEGVLYAVGRLVLLVPPGSPLTADATLGDLQTALADGRVRRFAIANPEHAPYGQRAEEALRHRGLWGALQPHLVYGENVSQAAQFATSGNAAGGIIAYSLALAPQLAGRGDFVLLPQDWHRPLHQRMALLRGAGPVAERFYAYLQQPAARETLARYGFEPPAPDGHAADDAR